MRSNTKDLDLLEPLWGALQAHHASILPHPRRPNAASIAHPIMDSATAEL